MARASGPPLLLLPPILPFHPLLVTLSAASYTQGFPGSQGLLASFWLVKNLHRICLEYPHGHSVYGKIEPDVAHMSQEGWRPRKRRIQETKCSPWVGTHRGRPTPSSPHWSAFFFLSFFQQPVKTRITSSEKAKAQKDQWPNHMGKPPDRPGHTSYLVACSIWSAPPGHPLSQAQSWVSQRKLSPIPGSPACNHSPFSHAH